MKNLIRMLGKLSPIYKSLHANQSEAEELLARNVDRLLQAAYPPLSAPGTLHNRVAEHTPSATTAPAGSRWLPPTALRGKLVWVTAAVTGLLLLPTFLGGSLNAFPYTCFAQNVGLVRLTGVRSRFVVVAAGAFMIVLGLFPKAAAYVASIPPDVLGGAAVAMFGMVAVVGIQTLAKVDLRQERNALVVAVSIALALLPTVVPQFGENMPKDVAAILNSGITIGSISAIVLNLVFNVFTRTPPQDEEAAVPPAEPAVTS